MVDITPHPAERVPLIEAALKAGKHVLSQKPFVLDLDTGERLADLADKKGVKLAVNQNGRWAPHLAYMREAVRAGLIGDVSPCHIGIHWDHSWIVGTPFEEIDDLILFDFAMHWFDFLVEPDRRARDLGLRHAQRARRARAGGRRCSRRRWSPSTAARRRSSSTAPRASAPRTAPSSAARRAPCQHRARPRRPVGDADDRRGRRAADARGRVVQRRFRGTMGALLVAVEESTSRSTPRAAISTPGAGLCGDRLGAPRRAGRAGNRPQPRRRARLAALPNRPVVRGGRRRTAQDESVPISLDGRSALRKIPRHRTCADNLYVEKENTAEPIRTGHPRATCSKWRAIRVLH